MNAITPAFISLEKLARRLGVPAPWLRHEAEEKRIPHIEVNGRRKFNADAVERALLQRAEAAVSAPEVARD